MVSWESKADRGGRSLIRARSRQGGHKSSPPYTREKLRGLRRPRSQQPLAALPSLESWRDTPLMCGPRSRSLIGTYIQVRAPSLPHSACLDAPLCAPRATFDSLPIIPHHGAAASHRGQLVSRAGSPTYWAPRLAMYPSVHEQTKDIAAPCRGDPTAEQCLYITTKLFSLASQRWVLSAR